MRSRKRSPARRVRDRTPPPESDSLTGPIPAGGGNGLQGRSAQGLKACATAVQSTVAPDAFTTGAHLFMSFWMKAAYSFGPSGDT